jgi:hypothetical protein
MDNAPPLDDRIKRLIVAFDAANYFVAIPI